jgi:hypothetical protein
VYNGRVLSRIVLAFSISSLLPLHPAVLGAQRTRPASQGGLTESIGQPAKWHWSGGVGAGGWFEGPNEFMARVEAGAQRDLLAPDLGLIAAGFEGFLGYRGSQPGAGLRALLISGYLGGAVGAEYDMDRGRLNFLVRLQSPVRRGGLFGSGGQIRLNWYPTETHSFTLGLAHPLGQPRAGKTRPLQEKIEVATEFPLPVPYQVQAPRLESLLDSIAQSAEWIRRAVVPFLDHDGRDAKVALARMSKDVNALASRLSTRDEVSEVRWFHAALERAFSLSASDTAAGRLAAIEARRLLLEEVLLPYDALLGRKKRGDALVDLGIVARGRFGRWVASSGALAESRMEPTLYVFQSLLATLDRIRAKAAKEWDDPRLVWLPLQYALLPEDHDTQAEIDALIERGSGKQLEEGNRVLYLANLQFHWELLRMIRETERYHVLWIHDFPAAIGGDALDAAAFTQVVDGYLATLADRVERYDSAGSIPRYFIFLDQHYYEARKSRLWMTLLEDPLAAGDALPGASADQNRRLAQVLGRLRDGVRNSRVLQAEARQYGTAWLRDRISVHVSITYQHDPSFWGGGLISSVFGYPDNLMRDHRKLAFHDVSEDDPYQGMAIYTGMGVGEQYLGPTWEDRALLISGPVLLDLKEEVRYLLLSQGLKPDEIPEEFRQRPRGNGWDVSVTTHASNGFPARVMELHNRTGYEAKPLNVAKAILYSLMPPGSVIKIPDSLWNSFFFAGLLTGASCRGVHVLIISPATTNAPSAGFPQMSRAWELAGRLIAARNLLADAIAGQGGELRVGLYAIEVHNDAFIDRVEAWSRNAATTPFLRELMPFTDQLLPVMAWAAKVSPDSSKQGPTRPKLHHKVQFMANRAAWDAIVRAPEWPEFMRAYLAYRRTTLYVQGEYRESRHGPQRLESIAASIYARVAAAGSNAAIYAIVGSQNQDYRGMFMDGEVGVLLTRAEPLVVLADLVFLEGAVVWLDDQATLDRYLKPSGTLVRRLSRVAKDAV